MPLSVYSSFGHYMTQTRRMLDAYAGFFDRLRVLEHMLKNPFVMIYSVVIQQRKVVINIEVITRNSNSICIP